jgi:hypothetical protein
MMRQSENQVWPIGGGLFSALNPRENFDRTPLAKSFYRKDMKCD